MLTWAQHNFWRQLIARFPNKSHHGRSTQFESLLSFIPSDLQKDNFQSRYAKPRFNSIRQAFSSSFRVHLLHHHRSESSGCCREVEGDREMKITALLVMKCNSEGSDPIILANASDVSHFGYFQRSSVKEFVVFVGRTVAKRTPPNQRQSVQHEGLSFTLQHEGLEVSQN